MRDGKTIAVVPGSFDPITYGHVDIVRRALTRYDVVYLAVMVNSEKQYLFSLEERRLIAEIALSEFSNVIVISSEGMLWKLTQDLNADAIVKGYRNSVDYEYEMKMAEYNETRNPNAKTLLLKASSELESVSSSAMRARLKEGKSIGDFLPPPAACEVMKILEKRKNK